MMTSRRSRTWYRPVLVRCRRRRCGWRCYHMVPWPLPKNRRRSKKFIRAGGRARGWGGSFLRTVRKKGPCSRRHARRRRTRPRLGRGSACKGVLYLLRCRGETPRVVPRGRRAKEAVGPLRTGSYASGTPSARVEGTLADGTLLVLASASRSGSQSCSALRAAPRTLDLGEATSSAVALATSLRARRRAGQPPVRHLRATDTSHQWSSCAHRRHRQQRRRAAATGRRAAQHHRWFCCRPASREM